MAFIQNIVTAYKTTGAKESAAATNTVGKAQTRLAQSSASAGRSFAAQSQGLGGVVGVYAAAAANVFALTAAFTALNRSAQFETIIKGTNQLALAVGSSGTEVISSLKDITAGQLSIVEAATQANLALSAGFNVDQIEQLGELSLKASRALGRNLTDAFQRITRGAIKLEPELLDEIGIFTRIDPAVEAYANKLNKTVGSLTQFEKRQAFLNQILIDGTAAFSDINDSGESTQEIFERLVANFSDLAIITGKLIADSLAPFAAFLDQNLGNRLALLGSVGLLVFGSLKKAIAGFAIGSLASLNTYFSAFADNLNNATINTEAFTSANREALQAFKGAGALPGAGRGYGAELKRQLGGDSLTTQQALIAQQEIPNLLKNEIREREALQKNISNGVISQEKFNEELRKSKQRTDALGVVQKNVNAQLDASSTLSKNFATGLNRAAAAARILGTVLSAAFKILNFIAIALTAAQIVGSLFDIDIIGALKDAYLDFTAASRNAAAGLEALTNIAVNGVGGFESLRASLQLTSEQFKETIEASLRLADSGVDLGESSSFAEKQIKILEAKIAKLDPTTKEGAGLIENYNKQIADLTLLLNAATIAQDDNVISLTKATTTIGSLAEKSKLPIDKLSEAFAKSFAKINEDTNTLSIKIGENFTEIGKLTEDGLVAFSDELANAGAKSLITSLQIEDLGEKLADGSISADKAERSLGTIRSTLEALAKVFTEQGLGEAASLINTLFDDVNATLGETVSTVVTLDKFGKDLTKTFSKELKTVETSVLQGVVGLQGDFAKSSEEAALNQTLVNKSIVEQVKNLKALTKAERDLVITETEYNLLLEADSKIQTITQGALIQQVASSTKLVVEEQKKLDALLNQRKVLIAQSQLLDLQIEQARTRASIDLQNQMADQRVEKESLLVELSNQQISNAVKLASSNLEYSKALADNVKLTRDSINAEIELSDIQKQRAAISRVGSAESDLARAEEFGISSEKSLLKQRLDVAKKQFDLDILIIDQKKNQIERDKDAQLASLASRRDILQREEDFELFKLGNRKVALQQEFDLEKLKRENEIEKLENELKFLNGQESIAAKQSEISKLSAEATRTSQLNDLNILEQRIKFEEATNNARKDIVGEEFKILEGYVQVIRQLTNNPDFDITVTPAQIVEQNYKTVLDSIAISALTIEDIFTKNKDIADKTATLAGVNIEKQISSTQLSIDQLKNLGQVEENILAAKLSGIKGEEIAFKALQEIKKAGIDIEEKTVQDNFAANFEKLGIERDAIDRAFELTKERAVFETSFYKNIRSAIIRVGDIVENNFLQAFMQLNDAFVEGTLNAKNFKEGVQEFVSTLVKDVQRTIFEETVAKPAAGFIKDQVLGAFGQTAKKGIEQVQLTAQGAVPVSLVSAQDGNDLVATIKGESDSIFNNIGEKLKEFGVTTQGVFSQLGSSVSSIFSSVFSSLRGIGGSNASTGGIFGSLFGGFMGADPETGILPGFAGAGMGSVNGGRVRKLAAGGSLRDSVPALLEPGEFVVRKQAAKVAGPSNLASLNATGQMGGGNVSVNVTNTGTPQTAEASQPRFDGEKMVIDIVMRDLSTNGPIRRSLRAGGAS